MPGIFGFICKRHYDAAANQRLIDAMMARLSHNEDYEGSAWASDWCAIGTIGLPRAGERRLVVDISNGGAAAFSGYIYGWKDSTAEKAAETSDKAGRLLAIYRAVGEKCIEKIDGSFNAVVVDIAGKRITIGNDRMGHRQMYYYEDDSYFLFSGELKAFLAYEQFDRAIDQRAIADYFNFSYCLGDRTFFERVKRLPGSHILTLTPTETRFTRYWDFRFGDESTASIPELVEEADTIYRGVIRKQLDGATDVILPLSGGLDSRFIASHILNLGLQPRCFTHGVPGCMDLKIARQIARVLKLEHTFIDIDPLWFVDNHDRFVYLTDGMVNANPCMLLGIGSRYGMPARTTHFANGIFGGPTNFGGSYFRAYDIVDHISYEDQLRNLRRSLFGDLATEQSYEKFAPAFRLFAQKQYGVSLEEEFSKFTGVSDRFHHQKDIFFIRNRLTRFMNQVDCNRYLWHDHFALYDDALVDFYIRLPARIKCSRKFFSEYFKAKLPHLARITYQGTGVNLYQTPSPLRTKLRRWNTDLRYYAGRLSQGLINFYDLNTYYQYDQWFRMHRPIRDMVTSLLLDKRTLDRGYVDRKGLEELLSWQWRGGNNFGALSAMSSLESFFRQFVDR
ncbi:MAG: asparagine synthase-related protein [candidate division Zixibacteria bacterium]|jgi:hypothetical protein|nr:asparagine synthase-related protein [candidate division Zixibacteria bacterium]